MARTIPPQQNIPIRLLPIRVIEVQRQAAIDKGTEYQMERSLLKSIIKQIMTGRRNNYFNSTSLRIETTICY
jgi:hypothetical protein